MREYKKLKGIEAIINESNINKGLVNSARNYETKESRLIIGKYKLSG
jgi:hypothetical protein